MSNTATIRTLKPYINNAPAPGVLQGLFATTPESFKNSVEVRWDVKRDDEDIAYPLASPDTGSYHNRDDEFEDKKVIPPPYGESFTISASSLGKNRQLGKTEYEDPGFIREANERAAYMTGKLQRKLRRGMELQASQILTVEAGLSLINDAGKVMYALDYLPKSTHFPNAGVAWSTATLDQMLGDLKGLGEVIRNDGLNSPARAFVGTGSFEYFLAASDSTTVFDSSRADRGQLVPLTTPGTESAQYRGTVDVGNYKLDLWTYGGRYKHPQTGTKTLYIPDDKVVMLSDKLGFETVFGGIFLFNSGLPTPLRSLRFRGSMVKDGMDIFFNNWTEINGSSVKVELLSRPLLIPKGIDTFGCLDTGI